MLRSPLYNRVLLKLSGELLAGSAKKGISSDILGAYAKEIAEISRSGVGIAIVVGGGNIFRGRDGKMFALDRSDLDKIGMLSTVMNSIVLKGALNNYGIKARVMTATTVQNVGELYSKDKALGYMDKGEVIIFAGGTGLPYFSTDTASAIRAIDIRANVLLKATKVDGIYDKDPMEFENAKKFDRISYSQILQKQLRVMDLSSIALCMDNDLPALVFNATEAGNILKAVSEGGIGTLISKES